MTGLGITLVAAVVVVVVAIFVLETAVTLLKAAVDVVDATVDVLDAVADVADAAVDVRVLVDMLDPAVVVLHWDGGTQVIVSNINTLPTGRQQQNVRGNLCHLSG